MYRYSINNTYETHQSNSWSNAVEFAIKMAKEQKLEPVVIRDNRNPRIRETFIWNEETKDIIPFYGK